MRPLLLFVRVSAALCVAAAAMWGWSGSHAQSLRWAARSDVGAAPAFPGPVAAYYRTYFPDGDRAYAVEDRLALEWADGHVWFVQERVWQGAWPSRREGRPEGGRFELVDSGSDWYPESDDYPWTRLAAGARVAPGATRRRKMFPWTAAIRPAASRRRAGSSWRSRARPADRDRGPAARPADPVATAALAGERTLPALRL